MCTFMSSLRTVRLAELYVEDETTWLKCMAELVRQRRLADLDLDTLSEYLREMASRDRRAVKRRLALLRAH
jgi:hypothetical protein